MRTSGIPAEPRRQTARINVPGGTAGVINSRLGITGLQLAKYDSVINFKQRESRKELAGDPCITCNNSAAQL